MPTPPSPVVESATRAFANVGMPFQYLIRATSHPTSFSATGLDERQLGTYSVATVRTPGISR